MKTYETVIILDDRRIQDEGKTFVEEFSSKISRAGGEIIRVTSLGRKQFARLMKKRKTGFYWDFVINLEEKEAKKLPEYYNLDERVLRLQTFVYDRPEKPVNNTAPEKTIEKREKPLISKKATQEVVEKKEKSEPVVSRKAE